MSAREVLLAFLEHNEGTDMFSDPQTGFGLYPWEVVEEYVDNLLASHAHELAEEIRAEAPKYNGGAWDGIHIAADLIDPEVGGV